MLPKAQRIHTDADFRRLRTKGKKWQSPSFIALQLPARTSNSRLGIIVSNKIGKAVVRKRASRVLRAAYAQVLPHIRNLDMVLIARPYVKQKSSREVAKELENMLRRGR